MYFKINKNRIICKSHSRIYTFNPDETATVLTKK